MMRDALGVCCLLSRLPLFISSAISSSSIGNVHPRPGGAMKKKQVWRYYCEFCKKAGCSGGHMKRHESTCTANPKRYCRMCDSTIPPTDHLAILFHQSGTTTEDWKAKMKALREAVDNCPACILAVIRQSGIQKIGEEGPSTSQENMEWDGHSLGFDFKAEKGEWLRDKNERQHENISYYC